MFFKEFPVIPYQFNIGGKNTLRMVRDITLNVQLKKQFLDNLNYYSEYDIQEGETPERIAEKIYGNSNYHWLIMMCNNKFDYSADFPLSQDLLFKYVSEKYGEGNENDQHIIYDRPHFETPGGFVVDEDYPEAIPISNYEYEFRLNEKKRKIKIVNPRIVNQIVNELRNIV